MDLDNQSNQKTTKILLTGAGCPGCEQAKEQLKGEIDRGEVRVVDIMDSDPGVDLVSELDIRALPEIITVTDSLVCLDQRQECMTKTARLQEILHQLKDEE